MTKGYTPASSEAIEPVLLLVQERPPGESRPISPRGFYFCNSFAPVNHLSGWSNRLSPQQPREVWA